MENVFKIVLTGGPGGGKTKVTEEITRYLEKHNYKVFLISETATEIINSGLKMFGDDPIEPIEFQRLVFKTQLFKEHLIESAIENYGECKKVIILDRGLMDNKAYITNSEFELLLSEFNLTEEDICKRYDIVIHLNTAAYLKSGYTKENNKARSEDEKEAIIRDQRVFESWSIHNNHYIVKPEIDFDIKKDNVLKIVQEVLEIDNRKKYVKAIKKCS